MALVITNAGSTFTTTAGNKTVTATPAVDDLNVVVAACSGMTGADAITVSDNNAGGGGTYTNIVQATGGGTDILIQIWVRNARITSATSTVYTMAPTGDTGGGLWVGKVTGMLRAGTSAVLQSKGESTQTENPPSFSFTSACQSGNGGIVAIGGEDNPPALTAPTSWPESIDTGYATPTTGIVVNSRNSTSGDQTLNWTGGALADHCEVGVELDATAPPAGGEDPFPFFGGGYYPTEG